MSYHNLFAGVIIDLLLHNTCFVALLFVNEDIFCDRFMHNWACFALAWRQVYFAIVQLLMRLLWDFHWSLNRSLWLFHTLDVINFFCFHNQERNIAASVWSLRFVVKNGLIVSTFLNRNLLFVWVQAVLVALGILMNGNFFDNRLSLDWIIIEYRYSFALPWWWWYFTKFLWCFDRSLFWVLINNRFWLDFTVNAIDFLLLSHISFYNLFVCFFPRRLEHNYFVFGTFLHCFRLDALHFLWCLCWFLRTLALDLFIKDQIVFDRLLDSTFMVTFLFLFLWCPFAHLFRRRSRNNFFFFHLFIHR